MSHSKNLRKMPNFGEIPNLERLKLEGCEKLVLVDPPIGVLRNLVVLNLKDCKNLASIPNNIFGMSSLKDLNLSGCPKVFKNQRRLKKFDSSESSSHFQSTTSSIFKWTTLIRFRSKDSTTCLLRSLLSFSCLRKLDISFCGLSQLFDAIGCLRCLEELNLGGNNFVTLPSLKDLSKLLCLNLEHCKLLESLPQLPFPTAIKHDLPIDNIDEANFCKIIGLVIFNCPKLGESERCSSMAFSWMTQLIRARQQSSTASFHEIIDIVIPGSEVPIWFNNKSEGDSIKMDISPIMHDDNDIIGIVRCVVFSVAPVDPTITYAEGPHNIVFRISNSKTHCMWGTNCPVILESDLIVDKSNHMCLVYYPLELFVEIIKCVDMTLNYLDDIKLTVLTRNAKGLNLEVQSCGYHWVYKQESRSCIATEFPQLGRAKLESQSYI